jgi:hypothetical protein
MFGKNPKSCQKSNSTFFPYTSSFSNLGMGYFKKPFKIITKRKRKKKRRHSRNKSNDVKKIKAKN